MFKYAALMTAKLDMISVVEVDGVGTMRCLHLSRTVPKFANNLSTGEEARMVTLKTSSTPKFKDRGVHYMFVGYALDHDGDYYQMKNIDTGREYNTRNIGGYRECFT